MMTTIGRTVRLRIGPTADIPARVDTGAHTSSIWATEIRWEHGEVGFVLFGPGRPYYTGKRIYVPVFREVIIANTGGRERRYVVRLPVTISGREILTTFTLSDRSQMRYPILIGRRLLNKKFIVDVSFGDEQAERSTKSPRRTA